MFLSESNLERFVSLNLLFRLFLGITKLISFHLCKWNNIKPFNFNHSYLFEYAKMSKCPNIRSNKQTKKYQTFQIDYTFWFQSTSLCKLILSYLIHSVLDGLDWMGLEKVQLSKSSPNKSNQLLEVLNLAISQVSMTSVV